MHLRLRIGIFGGLALTPLPALAHLVSTGLGPLYDGIGHFFISFEDLLPLMALFALGGLQGPAGARRVVFGLPVIWAIAALVAAYLVVFAPSAGASLSAVLPRLLPALTIALGLVVALDVKPSSLAHVLILVVAGGVLGVAAGSALGAQAGAVLMLLGSFCGLCVMGALMTAGTLRITQSRQDSHWRRIVIRVGGSWIAGVGLLMLGWQLRG